MTAKLPNLFQDWGANHYAILSTMLKDFGLVLNSCLSCCKASDGNSEG